MTLWVILVKEPVCRGGREHGARDMEQGTCAEQSDEVTGRGRAGKKQSQPPSYIRLRGERP